MEIWGKSMVGRHWSYLKYVVRHKWYVGIECFREGLYWRGLIHDWTKFLPREWFAYANHFYNPDGTPKKKRGNSGYYQAADTGDKEFDYAWLSHQNLNSHHWQYYVLLKDNGSIRVLEMPHKDVVEMICDWVGAGKAQGFTSPKSDPLKETRTWYAKNKDKMQLHPATRAYVERYLEILTDRQYLDRHLTIG